MSQAMFTALIKYNGKVPSIMRRHRNEVFRQGYRYVLAYWHEHFRDKHFTNRGATEYGYTPRKGEPGSGRRFKGSYTERKLKQKGHTRPLEFSGETRRRAGKTPSIRATGRGARLKLDVPALNFRHPNSKIYARSEMVRISPQEQAILQREFQEFCEMAFRSIAERQTITI